MFVAVEHRNHLDRARALEVRQRLTKSDTTSTTSTATTRTSTTSARTSSSSVVSRSSSSSSSISSTSSLHLTSSISPASTPRPTKSASYSPSTLRVSSSAVTSPSATAPASSGASSRAIVGAVAGVIIGLGVFLAAIVCCVRYFRKRRDREEFDRGSFRRSAVVLSDPPTHADTVERGFNPRPPSMIERRLANTPPATPQSQHQFQYIVQDHTYDPLLEHGQHVPVSAYASPSFSPTQYSQGHTYAPFLEHGQQLQHVPVSGQGPTNENVSPSFGTVQPLFTTMQQEPSPFTPVASPIAPIHGSREPSVMQSDAPAIQQPGPSPFTAVPSPIAPVEALREPPVALSNTPALNTQLSRSISTRTRNSTGSIPAEAHYLDVTRSSVSPYQAMQYAAISRTLDEFPLPAPFKIDDKDSIHVRGSLVKAIDPAPPYKERQSEEATTDTGESPFADTATSTPPYKEHQSVQEASTDAGESPFADTAAPTPAQDADAEEQAAPALSNGHDENPGPSSNGHDTAETLHHRINSNPPMLPEIGMSQRTFSPTPFSAAFDSMMAPSVPDKNGAGTGPATTATSSAAIGKRPETTYGQFDLNDAYDGI